MTREHLLQQLYEQFLRELETAADQTHLENLRVKYLGRNGLISELMAQLKELSIEEKRQYGPLFNALKTDAHEAYATKKSFLEAQAHNKQAQRNELFDVTAYVPGEQRGSLHPYTLVIEHLEDTLITMGFELVDGPEVETDEYNFQALNIPADHPARDLQDTFWLTLPSLLLRTHTSTVQIHTLKKRKPPIAIAAHGRCYRNEATDASHDFMFMQTELMLIDKNVSLANLSAIAKTFLQALFEKKDITIRIRPSYFPFVEPGVEVDMSCPFCTKGCSVCKKSRWIEIGGAGLIHPNVLNFCGINPEQYSGLAFGFGLTRLVMLKYGINDIRLLHTNRLDFLKQF